MFNVFIYNVCEIDVAGVFVFCFTYTHVGYVGFTWIGGSHGGNTNGEENKVDTPTELDVGEEEAPRAIRHSYARRRRREETL